jgi:hypothetical protein
MEYSVLDIGGMIDMRGLLWGWHSFDAISGLIHSGIYGISISIIHGFPVFELDRSKYLQLPIDTTTFTF